MNRRTLLGFGALSSMMVLGVVARRRDAPPRWPARGAKLTPPRVDEARPIRTFLDAGHGAAGNMGNVSAFCVPEERFTRSLADDVAGWLVERTPFEVRRSRRDADRVGYAERVAAAEAWGADVFVSLHSDIRGDGRGWSPSPGRACTRSRDAPGFSVLWADEGAKGSRRVARAVATALRDTGFIAYGGAHYGTSYAADAEVPGVFVDRHAPGERLFVLRTPSMPAILVETHHALDDREAVRWEQASTRAAFAAALAHALSRSLPA